MRKWAALLGFAIASALLWRYQDLLYAWLKREDGTWIGELLTVGAAFLIALVPALPYGAAAAVLGAKYGAAAGSLINLGVSVTAAAVLFAIVRGSLTAEQRRKAAEMKSLTRLTSWFESEPFAAVLFARTIPVVPAQAVNVYAALTRMGWTPYLAASVLGKLPFLLAVTLLGDRLMASDWSNTWKIAGVYAVFLAAAAFVYRGFRKRREKRARFPEGKTE